MVEVESVSSRVEATIWWKDLPYWVLHNLFCRPYVRLPHLLLLHRNLTLQLWEGRLICLPQQGKSAGGTRGGEGAAESAPQWTVGGRAHWGAQPGAPACYPPLPFAALHCPSLPFTISGADFLVQIDVRGGPGRSKGSRGNFGRFPVGQNFWLGPESDHQIGLRG